MSTTAKSDSITISSTIGTARRMTARVLHRGEKLTIRDGILP